MSSVSKSTTSLRCSTRSIRAAAEQARPARKPGVGCPSSGLDLARGAGEVGGFGRDWQPARRHRDPRQEGSPMCTPEQAALPTPTVEQHDRMTRVLWPVGEPDAEGFQLYMALTVQHYG